VPVDPERVVERIPACADRRYRERDGAEHERKLDSAVLVPDALLPVHRRDRADHHADQHHRCGGDEQAEGEQEPPAELGRSGDERHGRPRPEAE
jgi:hypothetical protein